MDLFVDRYDTVISKSTLSGGQKQRISIARAFYKNPKIILLDEFTSSLDNESQAAVLEAVKRLMENRTVVLISHKLTTIQELDQITVTIFNFFS